MYVFFDKISVEVLNIMTRTRNVFFFWRERLAGKRHGKIEII